MSRAVEIRPVTTRRDLRAFVRFPWRVYRGDPLWVPPLICDRIAYLDPAGGGFHAHADVALFAAREGRRILGTIAAFVDHDRVRHTGRQEGGFGFFEVLEDYEAAVALLDACRGWLRQRGMASVRGPTNFGENDCPGVLIAGTDFPPAMMEAHTPPYYREFLERYGMEKDNDAFAWRVTFDTVGTALDEGSSDLVRVAEAARRDASLSLRRIRLEEWDREVSLIRGLFNATLSHLPGAAPMGEEDFGRTARALKPFLDPELGLIAEVEGKPVGYCLLIPDTNRVLARLNGRLLPFRWIKLKRYIREIDVVSFKLLGVLKEYRRRGIDALLYVEALRKAKERGYAWLDGSLTSEQNPAINLIARNRGAECYKHYRVYRMAVPGDGP
jgi:GNAT superfamily N-acetyltransferase